MFMVLRRLSYLSLVTLHCISVLFGFEDHQVMCLIFSLMQPLIIRWVLFIYSTALLHISSAMHTDSRQLTYTVTL